MASFNKVILAGNLTRDPELRYTPKGSAVAELSVAINRTWKGESGETKEEVSFIDVVAYGRTAEVICQYLKKGRPLLVEGRLKQDVWEDKQTNQKRSKLRVICENFQFLDSNRTGEGSSTGPSASSASSARTRPAPAASSGPSSSAEGGDEMPPEEDDVPF